MLALLCLASGCAFGDRQISLRYQPVVNERAKVQTRVVVADFDDQRGGSRLEVGCIRNGFQMKTARVLVTPGQAPSDWIRDALIEELRAARLDVTEHRRSSSPDDLVITGEIKELYSDMTIIMVPCRMRADIAVLRGDQAVWDRRYEVNHQIAMTTASPTEYEALFQGTLQNLMRQAVPDVLEAIERDEIARASSPPGSPPSGPAVAQAPTDERSPTVATTLWMPTGRQQVWVLAIGVGHYKNAAVPVLPFAKSDAEGFRDWFLKLSKKQVPVDNVRILTDEQATRQNILEKIDWLRKQALPEDAVFVYFAGHGAPELASDGKAVDAKYLVLHDTDPTRLFATGLSIDELSNKLDTIKARTQVLVLEACYAGPVGQDVLRKTPTADLEIRPRVIREMGEKGGRVILSASTGRQMAIGSKEIKGSLFTHFLLDAWGDGSKRLLSNCFDDAREQVRRAANRLGSTQEPTRYGDQNLDVILQVKQ